MKKIKIWFLGFWPTFDFENNFITNILKKYYEVEINSKNPDYLIFTRYDTEVYKYKCVRIFYNVENFAPDFNLCDYAMGFDEIQFLDRYIRYPLYLITDYTYYAGDNYARDFKRMENKILFKQSDLMEKQYFCGLVVSRGGCVERDNFFEELCKYKKVLSGGAWKNNIGGQRVADKYEFLRNCKFSIAFENSSTPGYTTEKLMQAFAANTIPIYFGDPHIGTQFNTKAFINVHDYTSIDEAIEQIKEIDNNDTLYLQMMAEPALLPGYVEKKRKELDEFLVHIVEQEYKDAIRRHGQVIEYYEQRYKFSVEAWKFRSAISKLKKIFVSVLKRK